MVRYDGHGPGGILLQPSYVAQLVSDLPDAVLPGALRDAHTWAAARDVRAIALARRARTLVGLPAEPRASVASRSGPVATARSGAKKISKDDLLLAGQCVSNAILECEKHLEIESTSSTRSTLRSNLLRQHTRCMGG
jgi:hypothetical protein